MIKSALKITGLFIVFLFFMSLTFNKKPIFNHIYSAISPLTRSIQNGTESFFEKSFSSTQAYSKKIFDNSVPKVRDSVKSKMSSRLKNGAPAEEITHKEKQELDQLIKNH